MQMTPSCAVGRVHAVDEPAIPFGPVPGYRIVRVERTIPGLPLQVFAVREGPLGFQQSCVLEAARLVEAGGSPALVHALVTEASIASLVRHPSIAVVHDVLEHDGWLLLVRPVEGNLTLAHLIAALGRHTRRLDESIVWHVAHTLFDTLDEAHHTADQSGSLLVHGDVRPANLVVRPDGGLVVRGFCGSRASYWPAGEASRRGLYDCPLRLEGRPPSIASDLYAAAAVVWELLVDAPLAARYHAPGALLNSSEERTLPSLALVRPEIPHAAAAAIDLCLSMDPDAPVCNAASVANIIHRSTDALAGREKLARLHGNVFARMGALPKSRWATAPSRPGGVDCDAPTERVPRSLVTRDDDTRIPACSGVHPDLGLGEDELDTVRVIRSPSGIDAACIEPWEAFAAGTAQPRSPRAIPSFPPVANNVSDSPPQNAAPRAHSASRLSSAAMLAAVVVLGASALLARGLRSGPVAPCAAGSMLSRALPAQHTPAPEAARAATQPTTASPPSPIPPGAIPVWRSSLIVHGPPDGVVFVQGVPLGRTGQYLETPCGMRNVRVGTEPRGRSIETVTWLAPGQAVNLPCGAAIERKALP